MLTLPFQKVVGENQEFCGATLWTQHERSDGRLCITNFTQTFRLLETNHHRSNFPKKILKACVTKLPGLTSSSLK